MLAESESESISITVNSTDDNPPVGKINYLHQIISGATLITALHSLCTVPLNMFPPL